MLISVETRMQERVRHPLAAYGVALVATAASLLVRWPLWPVLGNAVPQMTFFPAVMIAAYFGGFWPGFVATVLSAFAANYFLAEQPFGFHFTKVNDIAAMALFVLVGTIISALCESLHRVRRHLVAEERRRGEEARRETEDRFRHVVENIQELFWITDARFERILFANPLFKETFGGTFGNVTEQTRASLERVHPDDRAALVENIEQRRRGIFKAIEYRISRPDGTIRWLRSRSFPVYSADGSLSRIAGLAGDITERKQSEEETRRAKDLLELAVRGSYLAIWEFDMPDGRIENSHPTLINVWEMLGHNPATAPTDFASVFALCVHQDDREGLARTIQKFLAGDSPEFEAEFRVPGNEGSDCWRLARGVALRDLEGKPIRFIGSLIEITDLKHAEEALRKSEQRFRTFVDHATDAFFLFNDSNVVLDVNRQACERSGYSREELIGMTAVDFDPDVTEAHLESIKRKLDDGELLAFESRHRRKDGTIFPVEIRGRAFWEGGRRFTVALARDISERKQDEALLEGQKRILERIIQGDPLGEVLTFLCRTIEQIAQGDMSASVLLLDPDGVHLRHGAAPGLPESYIRAIDGLAIGPREGSCGSAAYRREPVFVSDIANDPLWAPYAHLALSHDLRACWSSPILSSTAEVLGTFAMYYRQPRQPTPRDLRVVDIVARTVAVAIERSRAEEALRESEQRWRSLTEALPQLVWTAAPDGSCDYFSTQWTQYTGTPESELLGWRWLGTLHPHDRERTRQAWTTAVQGPGTYDVEYRVRRSDGEYRWFKTRGVPIRDGDGSVFKWFGTCTDITDAKLSEEALRDSEERFRNYFELSLTPMAITAPGKNWVRVNDRLCELLGYNVEELRARTWAELTHPEDLAVDVAQFERMMRGEINGYSLEKRFLHRNDEVVHTLLSVRAVREADGAVDYCLAQLLDITALKQIERELRQAKEAAESANRAKDEFLANVSHEIRTPMNAILGMTELVLDTSLSDDQRQSLRTVKSAADNLLGIINDLLDFSKIEAGKLELDPGDFSLRSAVADTLRALAARAHRKGLELACNVQSDVPDALIGDAGRLRQILLNLVGNAIKFTENGEVVVQVDAAVDESVTAGDIKVRFTVRDTGIGIPPEKQSTIFRAFEQEDTSTTRKYGGTGLGLTISAQLVALMGGTIAVQSELGRGSTFSFTAQFGRQAAHPFATAAAPPVLLHHLRVLIVDDNAANRHIMERWLRDWQMEPTSVGDGMAAMDALWHGVAVGKPHSLLLLDARMPDTDGLALAAKIRERAELSGSRIILLTSGDRLGELARFREQRVDGHLLKPVEQDELLETIYSIMSRTNGGDNGSSPSGTGPASGKTTLPAVAPLRILVAEDSEFNAQLMEKLLTKRGHTVRVVGNGRDALSCANAADIDLLLLDLHMPVLDGFQVIQSIREQERATGSHLPVIALTARSRKEDREHCLAAGMDDFLAKPIQTDDLWATIERVVGLPTVARPAARLIDARVLLAACGGDAAILKSICDTLCARLPDYLAAVQQALVDQDAPRVREAAHKLAGMISAFSTTAGAVASDVEDHAARGQLDDAATLMEQLNAMALELPRLAGDLSIEHLRHDAGNH
jgi:two-component system sensor histidine kinase/response regulator